MKVLQINSVCGIRSTGRICTGIAEVLEKEGHECRIAYGRENVPERYEKYAIRIGNDMGVNFAAFFARLFDNDGLMLKGTTGKLLKKIEEFAPDIIHIHNLHGYYINYRELFSFIKQRNIPVVVTMHDCWMFTGHCAYFDSIGCEKWENEGCHSCALKSSYPKFVLRDGSKKNFSIKKNTFADVESMVFVTPSEWLAALVKRSFLKDYPVKVINNGIDLTSFAPTSGNFREKYNLQGKKIVLGVASLWDERKGLPDLVKLSELLDDSYKVVVVGLSQEQISKLPANVIGIARTDGVKELAEIYSEASVLFNPTYEDNFPTVNLEALACGTPVVTYPTGGSPEAIDETCGIVTAERTPQSALEAIKRAEGISAEACITRSKQFDMNDKFGEYVELYKEILAAK